MNGEQPKTILILAANPKDSVPLRLDEGVREIKAGLQRSRHRERFVVEYESAARPSDVQQAMLDYNPQIFHFCGHGKGEKGLVLEDETGKPKLVSTEALANLFKLFSDQVECVLLNACYSDVQARQHSVLRDPDHSFDPVVARGARDVCHRQAWSAVSH